MTPHQPAQETHRTPHLSWSADRCLSTCPRWRKSASPRWSAERATSMCWMTAPTHGSRDGWWVFTHICLSSWRLCRHVDLTETILAFIHNIKPSYMHPNLGPWTGYEPELPHLPVHFLFHESQIDLRILKGIPISTFPHLPNHHLPACLLNLSGSGMAIMLFHA